MGGGRLPTPVTAAASAFQATEPAMSIVAVRVVISLRMFRPSFAPKQPALIGAFHWLWNPLRQHVMRSAEKAMLNAEIVSESTTPKTPLEKTRSRGGR